MNLCDSCSNKENLPGDCHISCQNPPPHQVEIGAGGDERYLDAKKTAAHQNVVVRCLWPGCGIYPICFDSNTVFGCCNYNVAKVKQ